MPFRFLLRMAWRDSRTSRRRLLLFVSCIVVGIAALVAVGSFGRSLELGIQSEARSLLGADLALGSRVRFTPDHEAFILSLGGDQAREITFTSMVRFPDQNGSRLAQIRALQGNFPFYGHLETTPPDADPRFRSTGGALVEESLLAQFNARVGDRLRIGNLDTHIVGALHKVPGETLAFATIAPRIFIRMADLEATRLLQTGSLARYRALIRLPPNTDASQLVDQHRTRLDQLRLATATVAERQEDLGQSLQNLYHFLNLVGFVALLLGGIGVASAIQIHVKQRIPTVAILRCLGCSTSAAFGIYLLQGLVLGLVGAALGTLAGVALQFLLPRVLADFVPFSIDIRTSWITLAEASATGFLVCLLFSLLPLAAIRHVAPLEVLRLPFETSRRRPDPVRIGTFAALAITILLFALAHTRRWQEGAGFTAGLILAFALLALVAHATITFARRLRPTHAPFVIRQGMANIHRPNNRTLLLVVSLGLGTFLLLTLHLTQRALLHQLISGNSARQANAILFDIQHDQKQPLAQLLHDQHLPLLDQAPIVTMRLDSIRGRPVESLLGDHDQRDRRWILRREFRSTFTDHLRDSESLVAGSWIPKADPNTEPIPVSWETGIAEELGISLGDEVVWDVQGIPLRTQVASLRRVDWRRVQPNFFVLFPLGPLDDAPAFHVLVTRVESASESAQLQRAVADRFPNVSVIDLTLVLRTLDQILGRIALALRFMALFTVATGLLVLAATVVSGRWQRVRESILLRVLGATRTQILRILLVEYATLGLLAATTGVVLAFTATAALCLWVFKIPFHPPLIPALAAVATVTALTLGTGWLASRGITTHPPLEILRQDP